MIVIAGEILLAVEQAEWPARRWPAPGRVENKAECQYIPPGRRRKNDHEMKGREDSAGSH